jgi:2-polyprenyl-3-methyl-5-hydroxy-6-metoxy-1,4-benzoquinol methylase
MKAFSKVLWRAARRASFYSAGADVGCQESLHTTDELIHITLAEVEPIVRSAFPPSVGYAESIERLRRIRLDLPSDFPTDPTSEQYRTYQLQLYEQLSGRIYDPAKTELAGGLSLAEALKNPFPYCTKDASTIGTYMMAVGHIIQVIGTRPATRILEFGSGWGHLTIAIARSGYQVTAIDIEPMFIELINTLAKREDCVIDARCGSFDDIPTSGIGFDVILFFACFHHCFDHPSLLPRLKSALNPRGRVILCNEPVGKDVVPYPWGIRLDGHALWAIRSHGWMELGFREDYLTALFMDCGFRLTKHVCTPAGDAGIIYEFEMQ